jgi:hypothetical protein
MARRRYGEGAGRKLGNRNLKVGKTHKIIERMAEEGVRCW